MIRITELPLPLDYTPEALRQAVLQRLAIPAAESARFHSVQAQLRCPQEKQRHLLHLHRRCHGAGRSRRAEAPRARPTCAASRRTRAITRSRKPPSQLKERPLVVGFGPCGLFAALAAGANGLQAHRAGARPRRTAPHAGHLGPVAEEHADAGIQCAVRRGRRGPVFRRQALQPDQGSEILWPQGDARVRARRCAGGDPVCQQAAHRHVSPDGRRIDDARGDHLARR